MIPNRARRRQPPPDLRRFLRPPARLLPAVALAAVASGGDPDLLIPEERRWLADNQSRIVLAVETGYAPFLFLDPDDRPTGLAQEYLNLIESKLETRFVRRRFSSLDEIFEKVRSGEVQIVNAVTKTPARAEFLAFTEPFITVPNVILVRQERKGGMTEGDLAGLRVSLIKGYAVTLHLVPGDPPILRRGPRQPLSGQRRRRLGRYAAQPAPGGA